MNYFNEYLNAAKELIKINSVESNAVDGKPFGETATTAMPK